MKLRAYQLTRYFFLFTVVILIVFGIGSLLRVGANPDRTILHTLYAMVMFGDAAVMSVCGWLLNQRMKSAFHLSVTVPALNILPTIFDQFGLADLLWVLPNLISLFALITARKEFLPA
jgi:hypothetical protein